MDAAPFALTRIAKPWGEELILRRTPQRVIKTLRLRPRQRLSLQFHRRKQETLLLLRGSAELTLGADLASLHTRPLAPAAPHTVPPGCIHRLSAGAAGADILEIADRLPDDAEDIVRLADDYGRAD